MTGPPGVQRPDLSEFDVRFNTQMGEGWGPQDRKSNRQCYWTLPESNPTRPGWVIIASATPIELVRQMDKGFKPRREFGEFQLWNAEEGWRVPVEPHRQIFQFAAPDPNVLRVFPVSQIIEHGWPWLPPYRGVTFPHLQEAIADGLVNPTQLRCPMCGKTIIGQTELDAAEKISHHEAVLHQQVAQNSDLARAISAGIARMSAPAADPVSQQPLYEQVAAMFSSMQQNQLVMAQLLSQGRQGEFQAQAPVPAQTVPVTPVLEDDIAAPFDPKRKGGT